MLTGAAAALALVAAVAPRAPQPAPVGGGSTTGRPTSSAASAPRTSTTKPHRLLYPSAIILPPPVTTPSVRIGGVLVAAALAPVREAGTLFRITDLRCGLRTVGSGPSADDLAPGQQACTALVTIRNVGRKPHGAGVQVLRDQAGRSYGSNGFLTRAMDRPALELHVLQPGERLISALVWVVPPGFRPAEVVVHGDLITLGARRRLG